MTAGNRTPDIHARVRRALVERAAGMLEDSDQVWLEEHVGTCEDCRQVAAVMEERAEIEGPGGHLPTRLVSRWDSEFPKLGNIVREYMLEHLRACEPCRNELKMLGHELPAGVAQPVRAAAPAPEPSLRAKIRRLFVRPWALATAGAAALGTLLIVNTVGRTPMIARSPSPSDRPPVAQGLNPGTAPAPGTLPDGTINQNPADPPPAPKPVPASPELVLAGAGNDSRLAALTNVSLDRTILRGTVAVDTALTFVVRTDERGIRLQHPYNALVANVDDADPLTITITTPSGIAVRYSGRFADLRSDRPLILRLPGGFEAGAYTFVYRFGGTSREAPIRGEIQIRNP